MFTEITDHVARAKKRLISQYHDRPNIEGTVEGIVTPIQDIETVLVQLNTERTLEGSIGIQLDRLGDVVGRTRHGGEDDDEYRQAIKAQIMINASEGQASTIIQAFKLLTGVQHVIFDEFYPAAVMIESTYIFATQADVDALLDILNVVVAGGVRVEGIVTYDPDEAFAFDGSLPGFGFGDVGDPSVGGKFAYLNVQDGEFAFDGSDPKGLGFGTVEDSLVGGLFVSL